MATAAGSLRVTTAVSNTTHQATLLVQHHLAIFSLGADHKAR
jgi:hypothetical protein